MAYPDPIYLTKLKYDDMLELINQCGLAHKDYLLDLFKKPPQGYKRPNKKRVPKPKGPVAVPGRGRGRGAVRGTGAVRRSSRRSVEERRQPVPESFSDEEEEDDGVELVPWYDEDESEIDDDD